MGGVSRAGGCCLEDFRSLEPDSDVHLLCDLEQGPYPLWALLSFHASVIQQMTRAHLPGTEGTGSHSSARATHSPGVTSPGAPRPQDGIPLLLGTLPTRAPPLGPTPGGGAPPPACPPEGGSSRVGDAPPVLAPGTRPAGAADHWPEARWPEVTAAHS